jgi:transposase-like protein
MTELANTPTGMQELLMRHGSQRAVAKALGIPRTTIRDRIRRWRRQGKWTDPKPLPTVDDMVAQEKKALLERHQQNVIQKLIREKARTEILADVIRQAVVALPEIIIPKPEPVKGPFDDEEACLLISDCQVGQEMTLEETGGLGEYNSEIFERRAHNLLKSVRKITSIHRMAYDLPMLHIWFLGDIGENESIFEGQRNYIDSDVLTQLFRACDVFCEFIVSLLADYPQVKIVGITGNHGRVGKKGEFKEYANWDRICYHFIEARLRNEKRITFDIPKSWWRIAQVRGWKFLLTHGDDIRAWRGFPYYGVDRADANYTLLLQSINESYEYFVCGHHHNRAEFDRPKGEKIVNGAWPGGSIFSLKKLNTASEPSQLFFGVHERKKITWRYKLLMT